MRALNAQSITSRPPADHRPSQTNNRQRPDSGTATDPASGSDDQIVCGSWCAKCLGAFLVLNLACFSVLLAPVCTGASASTVLTALLTTTALQASLGYWIFHRPNLHFRRQKSACIEVIERHQEQLERTQEAMIVGLSKLASSREGDPDGHIDRVSRLSTLLAEAAQRRTELQNSITPEFIRLIRISSSLHDIGKVGIEDAILMKSGSLNPAERARIQAHPKISSDCLQSIQAYLGDTNFLQMAHEIALFHHERWDGKGYPTGIGGPFIPLSARIVAIADVYDALATRRCYKEAFTHDACVEAILEGRGTQFDPLLVDVFLSIHEQFRAMYVEDVAPLVIAPSTHKADSSLLGTVLRHVDQQLTSECCN